MQNEPTTVGLDKHVRYHYERDVFSLPYLLQLLIFIQTRQQGDTEEGNAPLSSLDILTGSQAGQLSHFIKTTVSIHSILTDRIDQLRPSQQLTLKVSLFFMSTQECQVVMKQVLQHPSMPNTFARSS